MNIILGILIPLFGTSIGSSFVFFLRNELNDNVHKLMIGFSIGVMLASSFFSLLLPSIELTNNSWIPCSVGFIFGFLFLIVISKIANIYDSYNMLMFSVTLHNIPEGMAVGVAFAGSLVGSITFLEALLLSIGIAIQNIPEGSIISIPLKVKGLSKLKSFYYGFLSGVVEPLFSLITILLLNYIVPILPYLLSFASGAMIYVIFEELSVQIHENNNSFYGIIGIVIGFVLMMILDVSLG